MGKEGNSGERWLMVGSHCQVNKHRRFGSEIRAIFDNTEKILLQNHFITTPISTNSAIITRAEMTIEYNNKTKILIWNHFN